MAKAFIHEEIVAPSVPGNERNGEGDVIELSDGRLLMVYGEFYGTADHAPATLQGLISHDRGRTWCEKHLVQENTGGTNVMSVSLLRPRSGDLILIFIRKDQPRSHLTPFLRRSADEGGSWSEPEPIIPVSADYHVVNNDRLVQLSGGRILLPCCLYAGEAVGKRPGAGDVVFFSDDDGRTWTRGPVQPFFPESKSGAQEPGVVELRDGRVMMWCRCDLGQIYVCHSADGGETFGPWAPTGLTAPVSPAAIQRLPSTGDLLCVYNNHPTPPIYALSRTPLTAALSSDDGATWRIVGDLEPDTTKTYCYTSITFLPNAEILLAYYLGREGETEVDGKMVPRHFNLAHLKVGILREEWLYGAG